MKKYYIRNHGFLGNAFLWWKKGRNGYTSDIRQAEKFTEEEARVICNREEDTAYLAEFIDGHTESHKLIIDSQFINPTKDQTKFKDE